MALFPLTRLDSWLDPSLPYIFRGGEGLMTIYLVANPPDYISDENPIEGTEWTGYRKLIWNTSTAYKSYMLGYEEDVANPDQPHIVGQPIEGTLTEYGSWTGNSSDGIAYLNFSENNFEVLTQSGSLFYSAHYGIDYTKYSPMYTMEGQATVQGDVSTKSEIDYEMDLVFPDTAWDFGSEYPIFVTDPFLYFDGNYQGTRITLDQARMRSTYESTGWDFETDWKIIDFITFPYLLEPQNVEAVYEDAFPVKLPIGLCHIKYYSGSSHPIKFQLDGKVVRVGVVELTHASASPIKVMTPVGLMALEMAETRDQIAFSY